MRVLWKQMHRRPVISVVLLLALTVAVAVSLVGISAWTVILRQSGEIADNYVTIAIFNEPTEWTSPLYHEAAMEAALQSGCVLNYDSRCMLGAEIEGTRALTSGAVRITDYAAEIDSPSYSMGVLAITCTAIEPEIVEETVLHVEALDGEETIQEIKRPPCEHYNVSGTVNEVISLAEGYEPPKRGDAVSIYAREYTPDGAYLFEVGKKYLVFVDFSDHSIVTNYYESTDEETGEFVWKVVQEQDAESPYFLNITTYWGLDLKDHLEKPDTNTDGVYDLPSVDWQARLRRGQREDGVYYYYPMPEAWTHIAEYSSSVAEFLESEAGTLWREEIIPRCEVNQSSASVVLTDNMESLYMFNNGFAELLEGREISAEEYVNGGNVCIVSAEYAKFNNLHIGDKINVDYYDTLITTAGVSEGGLNGADTILRPLLRHGILTEEDRIGVKKDYEIVGIYSAPAFRGGTHMFAADTIFAPKASVPNAEQYEARGYRALQSLVLRNGSEEEFFESLKHYTYEGEDAWMLDDPSDMDFSGDFMTFNQQYDKAAGNIEVMRSNARRLLVLSLLGFLIVLAAVRYFEARRQRLVVVPMKKLGIAKGRITGELIGAGLLLDFAATALGGVLAWFLFGAITRRANVGTLQLPLDILLISAAAAAVLLAVTTVVSAVTLSKTELMQTKK